MAWGWEWGTGGGLGVLGVLCVGGRKGCAAWVLRCDICSDRTESEAVDRMFVLNYFFDYYLSIVIYFCYTVKLCVTFFFTDIVGL